VGQLGQDPFQGGPVGPAQAGAQLLVGGQRHRRARVEQGDAGGGDLQTLAAAVGAVAYALDRAQVLELNVLSALVSLVFGVLALVHPSANPGISDQPSRDAVFYAAMYGARSLVIGVAVCRLAFGDRRRLLPMLALAGLVQVGDVIIGVTAGQPGMAAGALTGTIVHLGSWWLLHRQETAGTLSADNPFPPIRYAEQ
jgi:hypothetical protein